jgi:hypothetical protein
MGIVLSASTIYFSSQVPEWTKDFESLHTDDVTDDFAELKSLVDGIVLKKGESELAGGATPVKMAPDKVPILGMSPSGSNLIFNRQDEKIEVIVPTGGGGGGGGPWEQNATTGFPYKDAYHVDNSSNEVKLARYAPEGDLILDGTTVWLEGEHCYNRVIINNSGILYVYGSLKIQANNISVDSSSKIISDGKGLSGGYPEKDGEGVGYGGAATTGWDGGGGGGYGASGGNGGEDGDGAGGTSYGSKNTLAIQMGSGGGGGDTSHIIGGRGGDGGGCIWLDAETIIISGIISANGTDGVDGSHATQDGPGGGGSGGGILIYGRNVTLSGNNLYAMGGDAGASGDGGGGGAGGRIKIFYEDLDNSSADYNVSGGTGTVDDITEDNGGDGSIHYEKMSTGSYASSITHYSSGYLVSEVYNTTSDSTCYGEMTWNATLNNQTLVMKVRTSMSENMVGTPLWTYCPAVSNGSDISDLSSVSDGHCYVQYCAELSTEDETTTPVLHWVKINYSLSAESPTVANSSGAIKFQSNYLYYPNQQIVYEHGAMIKWQHEGGFMLQPPPINFTNKSGIPAIEISMIDLTGSNRSYSGATSTSLKNTYQNYNLHADSLKYPNLTINVTTEYPSVWGNWFNKTLEETSLTTPHHYNVCVDDTAKTVSVEFYGHGDGVELYLEKTAVEVKI